MPAPDVYDLVRQRIPRLTGHHLVGFATDVDKVDPPVTLWDGVGVLSQPTGARVHNVASQSALDIAGNTGAHEIEIQGLDEDWRPIKELLTLDAQNAVQTANAYRRINRAVVTKAGSLQVNAGIIQAVAAVDGTVSMYMSAGASTNSKASFTIGRDQAAFVIGLSSSILLIAGGGAGGARFELNAISGVDGPNPVKAAIDLWTLVLNGNMDRGFRIPIFIKGVTDVEIRVVEVGSDGTHVTAGFELVVEDLVLEN